MKYEMEPVSEADVSESVDLSGWELSVLEGDGEWWDWVCVALSAVSVGASMLLF